MVSQLHRCLAKIGAQPLPPKHTLAHGSRLVLVASAEDMYIGEEIWSTVYTSSTSPCSLNHLPLPWNKRDFLSPLYSSISCTVAYIFLCCQSSCQHPCFQSLAFYPKKLPKVFPLKNPTISSRKILLPAVKIIHCHSSSTSKGFHLPGIAQKTLVPTRTRAQGIRGSVSFPELSGMRFPMLFPLLLQTPESCVEIATLYDGRASASLVSSGFQEAWTPRRSALNRYQKWK